MAVQIYPANPGNPANATAGHAHVQAEGKKSVFNHNKKGWPTLQQCALQS